MKRIGLFIATNLAIMLVLGIFMELFGLRVLASNGVDLDLGGLLAISFIIGISGSLFSLLMSKLIAKWMTGAKVIKSPANETERWLVATVKTLSQKAGIGMPDVAIFPAQEPNAFATGANRNSALVAVSAGLLSQMQRNEVEAVIGHEIGHIANNDMVTLALIQGVVNTFVFFLSRVIGHLVDRLIFRNTHGHGIGYFVVSIAAQIVLGILASTIVFWFSRQREYRADEAGAKLCGKENMIAALERLRAPQRAGEGLPDTMAAFGIRTGKAGGGWRALFTTHPPIELRIEALRSARIV